VEGRQGRHGEGENATRREEEEKILGGLWHRFGVDGIRVTALELPARFDEAEQALADVDALLTDGPATDVVLLPEASITGYVSANLEADLGRFAEPIDGKTAARLGGLAKKHRVHLVGPLVLAEGGRAYNAMAAFAPDGRVGCVYRKRHPWYVEAWATPGTGPLGAFEVRSARVAIAVCFDVHFLAAESAEELRAAEALLFASAWVEGDDASTLPPLLSSLAREHDVAIVNANWGPGVPRIHGQGGSRIIARDGEPLSVAPPGGGAKRIDATLGRG
jgi:predicted amidohydrolase